MKFVIGLSVTTLLFATSAWAKVAMPAGPTNILCPSAAVTELESLGATGEWIRHIDPEPGGWAFRSPTKTFGQWVEIRINSKGLTDILVSRSDKSKVVSLDKMCMKKVSTADFFASLKSDHDFTDKELEKIVKSGRTGLVYIWSPGMIYSVKHFNQFKDLCKKLGFDFVPVANFSGVYSSLEGTAKKFNLPADPKVSRSIELFMRGIQHHPTSYVYSHGKLSTDPILGVKPDADLKRAIGDSLARIGYAN